MRIVAKFSSFLVIAFKTFTLSLDKSDAKSDIVKCRQRKSSPAHFPPAPKPSTNLMQLTSFYFKTKFSVETLMELRQQCTLYFFHKQLMYMQEVLEWKIAKQFSGHNPPSLSNNENYRLKKIVFFLCNKHRIAVVKPTIYRNPAVLKA